MPQVSKFEDLIAWQKARLLVRRVYQITGTGTFARDFSLGDQIRRAAVSIMSNVAEGFERNRLAEFHQFLSIAKASCAETRSLLYVARDTDYISDSLFPELLSQAEEVAKILGGLRASIERELHGQSLRTQDSALRTS